MAALLVASLGCKGPTDSSSIDEDAFSPAVFANPAAEFGPQTRWWWPGASVDDAGLRDQLRQFADAGYSAIEIQPFMSALTNADLAEDPRIRAVGDATFLERLRTAACTAQELGLHWDITLGSGWSTGGVGIDDDGARQLIAAELTLDRVAVSEGRFEAFEQVGHGESMADSRWSIVRRAETRGLIRRPAPPPTPPTPF